MRFVLGGASGLIGKALVESLRNDGHDVTRLVRDAKSTASGVGFSRDDDLVSWNQEVGELDPGALEGSGVFVNLSGASLGDRRWSARRKQEILGSRVRATRLMAETAAVVAPRDGVLVSASAVGFYGDRGDEELTEQSSSGTGFLAEVCRNWEAATKPAEIAGVRVVHLRSGVVLARDAGALGKQVPLFRVGLGGRLGTGRQWLSWISLEDEIGAIRHAAENPELTGALNAVAPAPVTNADFTKALAGALHRPALLAVPGLALRVAFGNELAKELLLSGQRAFPARLLDTGYSFTDPDLAPALERILG
jgi:uncharacterized protein (TIGR01777 family)